MNPFEVSFLGSSAVFFALLPFLVLVDQLHHHSFGSVRARYRLVQVGLTMVMSLVSTIIILMLALLFLVGIR